MVVQNTQITQGVQCTDKNPPYHETIYETCNNPKTSYTREKNT